MVQTISVGTHSTTEYEVALLISPDIYTQVSLTTYMVVYELKRVTVAVCSSLADCCASKDTFTLLACHHCPQHFSC